MPHIIDQTFRNLLKLNEAEIVITPRPVKNLCLEFSRIIHEQQEDLERVQIASVWMMLGTFLAGIVVGWVFL